MVLIAVLCVGSGSVAIGASTVTFELGLGGSVNAARCPEIGPRAYFTGHDPSDGQVFREGTAVTWSVKVAATGTHSTTAGEYPVRGVANFVFDLEVHSGGAEGPLQAVTFQSVVNDGAGGCPTTAAAFAYSMGLFDAGPARVIDPQTGLLLGGPALAYHTYPTDKHDGRLLGMGAGYRSWVRTGAMGSSVAGLGQVTGEPGDPTYGTLGTGPVCEGQISGLPRGTYVLKLRPCKGNNVLRGDKDLSVSQGAFAVKADQVIGDEIVFTVRPARVAADFDGDGDVDLADFGYFQSCFNGPNGTYGSSGCEDADFDRDNDVDLVDFGVFQRCFNGPNQPPSCS